MEELLTGCERIKRERIRQIHEEGRRTEDDMDNHQHGELARAADCYIQATLGGPRFSTPYNWPWDNEWWKPASDVRMLVKAGALIAAEIDRRLALGQVE